MMGLTLRLHTLQGAAHDAEVADIREDLISLAAEIAAVSDPVYARLELLGLATAGRRFCEDASARHRVAIHFQEDEVPRDLPSDIALVLFRVLQEATMNAVVHSKAREIWVSAHGTATEVRVEIVDGGVGFDTQRAVPGDGVGLVAIRERLNLVNGGSVIVSAPGEGTRVEAWVPLRGMVKHGCADYSDAPVERRSAHGTVFKDVESAVPLNGRNAVQRELAPGPDAPPPRSDPRPRAGSLRKVPGDRAARWRVSFTSCETPTISRSARGSTSLPWPNGLWLA